MRIPKSHIILLVLGMLLMHTASDTALAVPQIYIPTEVQDGGGLSYPVNPAINNWAVLEGQPMPALWQTGSTIGIMAARGEYEPATFVVDTDTLLTAVDVTVGPLTGPSGTLHAETLDVRVAQPYYKRVTNWPATVPWVLVHDPSLFTIIDEPPPGGDPERYTKTNLLTRAAIDTATLQPADIAAGKRQQFWITAHINPNAKPGTYTAPVTVTPTNAAPMELTIEVRVPDLELLAPNFEYSVYYPAWPDRWDFPTGNPYAFLSDTQYVNEMANMQAHGLTNPNFYAATATVIDGSLDFTEMEDLIRLREQGGMNYQGKDLYTSDNPCLIVQRQLTQPEKDQNTAYAAEIVAWAAAKGYGDVYFMGNDEASGAGLTLQRDSWESIRAGGGKIFVAGNPGYYGYVGDLLDCPVLSHPGHILWDQQAEATTAEAFLLNGDAMADAYCNPQTLIDNAGMQAEIAGSHGFGYKVFSYMDPTGGQTLPEADRRHRGIGLWKANLDGTMTWSYTHIYGNDVVYADGDPLPGMINSLVFRGEEAPFDTLAFEGFREGVDDARYLATLQAAMAAAGGEHAALVAATETWLDGLDPNTDLDGMRQEMARIIEILAPLAALPGDITGDGIVGGADMVRLITNWGLTGATYSQGDIDGSGTVGAGDYNAILNFWGDALPTEPPSAGVPEPATLGLLLLSGLVLLHRRRK